MNSFNSIKKIIILMVFFTLFTIKVCSVENKINQIQKIIKNKDISVLGGIEGNKTNFVLIGLDVNKYKCGNVLLIIFDEKYKIINYLELFRNSTNLPIDCTESYFAFYLRPSQESNNHIIVYNVKDKIFQRYEIGYPFLWNIYINDNCLFFSTYMANPNLNVIDLEKKLLFQFDDFECGSVKFGLYNGIVYGGLKNDKYLYKWNGSNFEETQEIEFEQLEIRDRYIMDFPLDENVLNKLKLKL